MDCKRVNEQLVDFLYQELDADQADRIEGHLRQCVGCADDLAGFESTRRLMQQLPQLDPSSAITARLLAEAERAVQPESPGFWERVRSGLRMLVLHPAMTAATVLVLVLGVSFYAYRQSGPLSRSMHEDLPEVEPVAPVAVPTVPVEGPRPAVTLGAGGKTANENKKDAVDLLTPTPSPDGLKQAAGAQFGKLTTAVDATTGSKKRRARPRPTVHYRKGPMAPKNAAPTPNEELAMDLDRSSVAKRRAARRPVATTKAANTYLTQARIATKISNCGQALRLYHKALQTDPGLRRVVGPEVQRCVRVIGAAGAGRLEKAQEQLPLLAGWLEAEISESRRRDQKSKAPTAKAAAKPSPPQASPAKPARKSMGKPVQAVDAY